MAVRHQQQLATLVLLSMFLFRSLAYLAGGRAAFSDDLKTARESNLLRTDPDRSPAQEFCKGFPSPRRFSVQLRQGRTCPPFSFADEETLPRGMPQQQGSEHHAC